MAYSVSEIHNTANHYGDKTTLGMATILDS